MPKLSPEAETLIADIARREQVSADAVKTLLEAVARGGGAMAQFSHPELGGSGQWLRGGMTMVGDMFNNALKAKVDAICSELAAMLANKPEMMADKPEMMANMPGGSFQSQYQGSGPAGAASAFMSASGHGGAWWPAELGKPASSGAQNNMRYAYFPETRRLALERAGKVEIFDTGEHIIAGFGQQQGGGSALTLTSQLGTVSIDSLRRVPSGKAAPASAALPEAARATGSAPDNMSAAPVSSPLAPQQSSGADPAAALALIERLAELREKGLLTEEEFAAKKAELLSRI
jgi:hypothetical protein